MVEYPHPYTMEYFQDEIDALERWYRRTPHEREVQTTKKSVKETANNHTKYDVSVTTKRDLIMTQNPVNPIYKNLTDAIFKELSNSNIDISEGIDIQIKASFSEPRQLTKDVRWSTQVEVKNTETGFKFVPIIQREGITQLDNNVIDKAKKPEVNEMCKQVPLNLVRQITALLTEAGLPTTDCKIQINAYDPNDIPQDQYRGNLEIYGSVSLGYLQSKATSHKLLIAEAGDDYIFNIRGGLNPVNLFIDKHELNTVDLPKQLDKISGMLDKLSNLILNLTSNEKTEVSIKNNAIIAYKGTKPSKSLQFRLYNWETSEFKFLDVKCVEDDTVYKNINPMTSENIKKQISTILGDFR